MADSGVTLTEALARLRALEAKATKGPWLDHAEYGFIYHAKQVVLQTWGKSEEDFVNAPANRALIVASRAALLPLLAVAEAAEVIAQANVWIHQLDDGDLSRLRALTTSLTALAAALGSGEPGA